MDSKHTPGPWTVKSVFPDRSRGQTFGPRTWISAKVNNLDCRLADIPDVESPTSDLLADARLIAAAPDMLAALQYFAAVPCEYRGNIHCTMLPANSGRAICGPCAARAAIAKAVQS